MKKLMIALAAAATAIGLRAADAEGFISGAGFDSDDANAKYSWTADGKFVSGFWSGLTAENAVVIEGKSNLESVPAQFALATDDQVLKVATTLGAPIGVKVNSSGDPAMIGDGLYFDSLVELTAFDADTPPDVTAEAYAGAKVGLWVQLDDEEGDANHVYVWANGAENKVWQTSKENLDLSVWHRVTIKMIDNIYASGDPQVGFVVYIDGNAIDCTAAKAEIDSSRLTAAAHNFWFNGQLFLSMGTADEISEVLFDGKGSVDDIAFTTKAPDFVPVDKQAFKLAWTDKVASIEGITDLSAGYAWIDLVDEQTTYTYNYTAVESYAGGTFTVEKPVVDVTYTITPKLASAYIDGVAVGDIADAVKILNAETTTGPHTLKLAGDAAIDPILIDNADLELVIDLNGQTINGTADAAPIDIENGAVLITNTAAQAGIVNANGNENALYSMSSDPVVIAAGTFNGKVVVDNEYIVAQGFECKFSIADNDSLVAPDGYTFVEADDYYVLEAQKAEVTLTVTEGVGTTLTVTGSSAGEGKAKEGDVLTITAALASGDYKDLVVKVNGEETKETQITVGTDDIKIESFATAKVYVAQIGDKGYETLAEAIAAAKEEGGDTIKLVAANDITTTADNTIIFDKNLTLDLNGQVLTVAVGDANQFGTADGVEVTLADKAETKGKITITSGGYGFKVGTGATLNVACYVERTSAQNPVFDIYGGTVNCGADAEVHGAADIFRFKNNNLTSTVNVSGGKYVSTETDPKVRCIFHHYKAGHKANINITGGDFTFVNHLIDAYAEDGKTDPILNFTKLDEDNAARFSKVGLASADQARSIITEASIIADGCELVEDPNREGWFMVATKPAPVGPTSDEGQFSDPNPSSGRVTFTPNDPSAAEATINLNGFTGGVEVPGTIATIKGVPADQLKIQLNGYEIDNKYFAGGDADGFSTALSDAAKPAFAEATEDVKPFEVGEDAAVTIKAVPGLKYALVRGNTVDAITTTVVEATVAKEQTLKLEDKTPKADAAFYKVQVSK